MQQKPSFTSSRVCAHVNTTVSSCPPEAATASVPINRMKLLMTHLLASGDDDGVVKVRLLAPPRSPGCGAELRRQLWDPRKPVAVRKYTHHFDFISDFLWLEDKKQLVATRCAFERPPVTSLLSTRI